MSALSAPGSKKNITTMDAADRYLQDLYRGNRHVQEVAALLGYGKGEPPFGFAQKAAITSWYEKYGFGTEMVRLAAQIGGGEKGRSIPYINAILRSWYAKGYRTVRDIEEQEPANLQPFDFSNPIAPEDDILLNYTHIPTNPVKEH